MELSGKKVALLGFGTENQALLPYLQSQGAVVTVCDRNQALAETLASYDIRLGKEYLANLQDFDIIFRTPGIPYLSREIQEARSAGVTISSQTKLFFELCPAIMVGVTGTKGKGTTSSLIYEALHLASQAGEIPGMVYLAGNIGTPPITFLPQLTEKDIVVLELSSFQLQDMTQSPHTAVVLSIAVDHLDHHRDEAEYISAKKNIVRYQKPSDHVILNAESLQSTHFGNETPAKQYLYSRSQPVQPGAYVKDGRQVVLTMTDQEVEVCSSDEIQLVGIHNLENIAAASVAATLSGASLESIRKGMTSFRGLPYRLQWVAEKHGVRYYNDSFATTPDSTVAAIEAFSEPITLIVGGSSKNADFSELVEKIIHSTVTTVVCIGLEGQRIKQLLQDAGFDRGELIDGGSTMSEIVQRTSEASQPGSVVILSPAAASFDMFENYKDRGNQFEQAVNSLN